MEKLILDEGEKIERIREAQLAYKKYYAKCFWSFAPNLQITENDIVWVAEQLKKNGDREAWMLSGRLCR